MGEGRRTLPYVIGVDVGTTAAKVVACRLLRDAEPDAPNPVGVGSFWKYLPPDERFREIHNETGLRKRPHGHLVGPNRQVLEGHEGA